MLFFKIYVYRRKIQKEEEILGNQQPLCLIAIDENSLSLLSVIVSTIPVHFRTTSGPLPAQFQFKTSPLPAHLWLTVIPVGMIKEC